MVDTLGWRMKFGVLTASMNSVQQPEYDAMRPPGVTNHVFRIRVPGSSMVSNTNAGFADIVHHVTSSLSIAPTC